MHKSYRRFAALFAVLGVAAIAVAGCGGSSENAAAKSEVSATTSASATESSSNGGQEEAPSGVAMASGEGVAPLPNLMPGKPAGPGPGPMTGTEKGKQAEGWGTEAGEALGKVTSAPQITVGNLQILSGIESADRAANELRYAAKALGYKFVECNGEGNPAKWNTCGHTLLAEKVNVLFVLGIDPSGIPSVVKAAKEQGVPTVAYGGLVGPGYTSAFYPSYPELGKIEAEALISKLGPEGGPIAVENYPASWGEAMTKELKRLIKGTKVTIAAESTVEPANLVEGTKKTVSDQLVANPNLKALWFAFDSAGQVGAEVLSQKYPGETFPERPLLVTFHADPSTQVLMRKGAVDEVVAVNYGMSAWEAMNAAAEYFARKTPFPPYNDEAKYPGIGNPYSYQIVTKSTLPPEGQYVAPQKDAISYFLAKWKAEGLSK